MIAYDASTSGGVDSTGTTTFSFTCAVGASLFVFTGTKPTAVTYNGVSLTNVVSAGALFGGGHLPTMKVWYLQSPASGSHTVAITLSGADYYAAVSYTGTTGIENSARSEANDGTNQTQVTSYLSSVNTLTNNAWVICFAQGDNNAPNTFSGGRTAFGSVATDSVAVYDTGPVATPTTTSLTSTWSTGSGFISNLMLSIAPKADNNGNFFLVL